MAGMRNTAATMRGPTTWYSPLMKTPRCEATPVTAPATAMMGSEGMSMVLDERELDVVGSEQVQRVCMLPWLERSKVRFIEGSSAWCNTDIKGRFAIGKSSLVVKAKAGGGSRGSGTRRGTEEGGVKLCDEELFHIHNFYIGIGRWRRYLYPRESHSLPVVINKSR